MPHPLVVVAAAGAAALGVRMVLREMRRVGREVEAARERAITEREGIRLERDPQTGVYRAARDPGAPPGD